MGAHAPCAPSFEWQLRWPACASLVARLARRTLALAAALRGVPPSPRSARAQDYPTRPVELIVPFAAGGGVRDAGAARSSDGLAKRLGQPFVVLNRPGANTNLGTLAAVRAKPDGYTLLIASVGLAANPSLYKKLAFEPQSDLEPITLIANSPTRAGGAAVAAGQLARRIHRLCEGAAGRAQLRLLRRRQRPASRDRAVPGA